MTFGGGCILTKESIGYFRSGIRRDFVGERDLSEISEDYCKDDPSCDSFGGLSDSLGG